MQQIEMVRVDALQAYARNSRTHGEAQVAQLAASIEKFGFTNPVLIDGAGAIVAGHGRVSAARKLGLPEVPCLRLEHLTPAEVKAYVIADNQLALNAGWDAGLLALELKDLSADGFDLSVLGFSGDELKAWMSPGTAGRTDPDDAPEPPETPVSVLGDVWLLGAHRLVCGDCTNPAAVAQALAGAAPHLMVTDPPYGVEYDPAWRSAVNGDGPESKRATGKVLNDDRADWREAWALFPGDVAYVWHADVFSPDVAASLAAARLELRALIVWAKSKHTFGRGHYHHQHEPCWYAVRKGAVGHWSGDRKQTTLWSIDTNRRNDTGHGTQKPIECMKRPIENNSQPGDAVYEPFSGSGTTLIAAEVTGRACHAIELSPAYVDVAVKRWQAFTGKRAVREADGQPFPADAQAQ